MRGASVGFKSCDFGSRNGRSRDLGGCRSLVLIALVAILAFIGLTAPAAAEKRVALVIGNSAYQNVARLDNPRNDAALMGETLVGLGFTLVGDVDHKVADKYGAWG